MALALLCSKLKDIQPSKLSERDDDRYLPLLQQCNFKAFVVNHGVREGSREEAHSVAEVLKRIGNPSHPFALTTTTKLLLPGISTQVLSINWSSDPSQQPNFESLARRYRFQTLGKACYENGINALLLAHHQDDQAETLLMRLVNGHGMLGLTGIKADAGIPECHGLYGAGESGEINTLSVLERGNGQQLTVAAGGVKIYRPLLDFKKEDLRKTCEEASMAWFEDHTNHDPTLTMRNAVRKLYRSQRLPNAFSKPALLALSERARQRATYRQDIVMKLLAECKISRFETRSGTLQLRLPTLSKIYENEIDRKQLITIVAMFLRRILTLVSPYENIELSTLLNIVPSIIPGIQDESALRSTALKRYTIAGVQFTPISSSSDAVGKTWVLSRQPFTRLQSSKALHIFSPPSSSTQPILIDNRYWLRLNPQSFASTSPSVHALTPEILGQFLLKMDQAKRKTVKDELRWLAPGNVKWTLLALVMEGRCIGLPTMGMYVEGWEGCCEVMYKKIDVERMEIGEGRHESVV